VRPLPKDAGLTTCIEFQRRELERQRDLLSNVWSWYLGPLIPGMAVLITAYALANPAHWKYQGVFIAAYVLFVAAVFAGIGKLNGKAARKLQRQIDELDEAGR
jgi:membrane protein implicated in regulation of membrane protease activity